MCICHSINCHGYCSLFSVWMYTFKFKRVGTGLCAGKNCGYDTTIECTCYPSITFLIFRCTTGINFTHRWLFYMLLRILIRSSIGGCVLKAFVNQPENPLPLKGLVINRCAVALVAVCKGLG